MRTFSSGGAHEPKKTYTNPPKSFYTCLALNLNNYFLRKTIYARGKKITLDKFTIMLFLKITSSLNSRMFLKGLWLKICERNKNNLEGY